jgi:hypothetical protein
VYEALRHLHVVIPRRPLVERMHEALKFDTRSIVHSCKLSFPHIKVRSHLHTSACVSMSQHTSAYVSIRQHTSACKLSFPHIKMRSHLDSSALQRARRRRQRVLPLPSPPAPAVASAPFVNCAEEAGARQERARSYHVPREAQHAPKHSCIIRSEATSPQVCIIYSI